MNNELGISTGVFYKHYADEQLNEKIDHLSTLDVDIVEILFSRPFMLDIHLTSKNMAFLRKKKVALHAPFFQSTGCVDVLYDEELIRKLIDKAREINATHIVLHPDLLPSIDVLKNKQITFAFENLKIYRKFPLSRLNELIVNNPEFRISLDIGHAADWGDFETKTMLQLFKGKIIEMQFSIDDSYESIIVGQDLSQYDWIKEYDFPVILESRPKDVKDLPLIIKNIKMVLQ